jgi:hypothetical protein
MIATEQYGIRYKQLAVAEEAVASYITMMEEIIDLYSKIPTADKEVFNKYVGVAYNANLLMYQGVKANAPAIESYPLLKEFKAVLDSYYAIMAEIAKDTTVAKDNGYYALLFAAYEKACSLHNAILTSDDADLLNAYRTFDYIVLNASDDNESNDYHKTLEAVFDLIQVSARGYTVTMTHNDETKESYNAVEYYTEKGLASFFLDCYEVLYNTFCGKQNSKEAVLSLMAKRNALEGDALAIFYSLNLDACYTTAIEAFFDGALAGDEATSTLADKLLAAEDAYADYALNKDDADKKTAWVEAWAAVESALTALGTATENFEALLRDMYDCYLAAYNAMQEAA